MTTPLKTPRPSSPRLPAIVIGEDDLKALNHLADHAGGYLTQAAEQLLIELERARIVASAKLTPDRVRMGSFVTFTNTPLGETDTGPARTIQLVFPDKADIAVNRVSVLTPVGAALIGLSVGQVIATKTPDGRQHVLSVQAVE